MINVFMFCYLYCDYYHRSVIKEDSLNRKDNMRRYYPSYQKAAKVVLRKCLHTLASQGNHDYFQIIHGIDNLDYEVSDNFDEINPNNIMEDIQ